MLAGRSWQHFKIRTEVCCITRMRCENIFGALEIVGATEGKEKAFLWRSRLLKVGMLNDGTLSKQTGAVLDKYVQYHHLKTHPLKKDKLIEEQRNIISNLTNSAMQQEQFDKELIETTLSSEDEDQDEEVDLILAEIGSSSSEEAEESDENDYDNSSRVVTCTRSRRRATRFPLWTAQGKSWSLLILPVTSFRHIRRRAWALPRPQDWFDVMLASPRLNVLWKPNFRMERETFDGLCRTHDFEIFLLSSFLRQP